MTGVFIYILTLSVSVTPIIAGLLMLTPFFNKTYKAGWQYWLWLAVTLRLIFPFPLGEAAPVFLKLPVFEILTSVNGGGREGAYLGESVTKAVESGAAGIPFNFLELLALVYFTGAAAFLIYRLISYAAFRTSIKKWCGKPSGKIMETAFNIGQTYGIDVRKGRISVLICRKISGPMVVGFLRPVLLLPFEDYDDRKLKMILSHELVHIKRRDLLYKFLLILACSLHWFNPAVHFMAQKANQGLEVCCDAKVLQKADIDARKMYSHMIIELASQNPNYHTPALFNSFGSDKGSLELRINNIFSTTAKSRGAVSFIAIILITLFWGSAVQISAPAEAYDGTGKPVSHRNTAPASNTTFNTFGEGANANTGAVNEEPEKNEAPEKPEAPQALNGEQGRGDNPSQQTRQGSAEQEKNQPSESAEVVIVDLNQLKKSQEQEEFLPQE